VSYPDELAVTAARRAIYATTLSTDACNGAHPAAATLATAGASAVAAPTMHLVFVEPEGRCWLHGLGLRCKTKSLARVLRLGTNLVERGDIGHGPHRFCLSWPLAPCLTLESSSPVMQFHPNTILISCNSMPWQR
jgi:hypothetical protein